MAQEMCACALHILKQYKALIERGYSMPLDEAMAWEEAQSIKSARKVTADTIERRRQEMLEK